MLKHPSPPGSLRFVFPNACLPAGICVSAPLEVIVRKDFFVDLQLPYSAVRGEQLEIKAILHNYSPDLITVSLCPLDRDATDGHENKTVHSLHNCPLVKVRVDLIEDEHVCSSASKRRKYRQELRVGPETTRSVPFIVIPMKEGEHPIEVKAAVKDSSLNDGIRKMLRVVVKETMLNHLEFCDCVFVCYTPGHTPTGI